MDENRRVEQHCDRQELPECHVIGQPRGERMQRHIAERVIEEMAEQVAEENNAADQPHLTQADAAQRRSQMMRNRDGHTARVVMNSDARDLFPGSLVGRSVGKGLQSRLRGGALTRPAESGKSTA